MIVDLQSLGSSPAGPCLASLRVRVCRSCKRGHSRLFTAKSLTWHAKSASTQRISLFEFDALAAPRQCVRSCLYLCGNLNPYVASTCMLALALYPGPPRFASKSLSYRERAGQTVHAPAEKLCMVLAT